MHYKLKADVYYEEGKLEEALALYKQTLAAAEKEINDPAYIAEIYTFMANIYQDWGQGERVLESLEAAARIAGDSFKVLAKLARLYEAEARWAELKALAQRLIELQPDNPQGYFFLSKALFNLGEREQGK